MGSSKEVTTGFRYYMTLFMGLCRGPIDEVVQIRVGDLRAWPVPDRDTSGVVANVINALRNALLAKNAKEKSNGLMVIAEGPDGAGIAQMATGEFTTMDAASINTMRATGTTSIQAKNLFGGDKKEGGIDGSLLVAMGTSNQNITAELLSKKMTGNIPGFRGLTTLLFDGLLTSMNPYPKKWSVRVRRTMNGWDGAVWQPNYATIWMQNGMVKGANGAHIIYECLTNRDWGRGFKRNMIHEESFLAAAQKLHSESFGLCFKWTRSTDLDEFIATVIDHIGGALFTDRTTGQIGLNLLRDDYTFSNLPLFTYTSGLRNVSTSKTSSRNNIANEIVVEFFDPVLNRKREVRVHNLASQQSLGGKITMKKSYVGAPGAGLALRLAQRDLRASVRSLKQFDVQLDRRAWKLVPGDVFRISAPDLGITDVAVRAVDVEEDERGNINAKTVVDVFGVNESTFGDVQPGEWNEPDRSTTVPPRRIVREAQYGDLVRMIDPANLRELTPEFGIVVTLASRPSNLALGYKVATSAPGLSRAVRGTGTFMPSVLAATSVNTVNTVVSFNGGIDLGQVQVGMPVQLANEIARLDDISTLDGITGTITIARGCADTIPNFIAAGEPIFFLDTSDLGADLREYAQNETVNVRMMPFSSTNELPIGSAPDDSLIIYGRHSRPWPPGRVQVNGHGYRSIPSAQSFPLTFTWTHRNRRAIQDRLIAEDEPGTNAEGGTRYRIRVLNAAGTAVVRNVPDINGTSWTYTSAMAAEDGVSGANPLRFELMTERTTGTGETLLTEQSFYRHRILVPR